MKKLVLAILIIVLFSLMPVSASQHTCVSGPIGTLGIVTPVGSPSSFAPGETINVQADIINSDLVNSVTGVVLQAVLINENTGNELLRATSSQQSVVPSGTTQFTVNLVAPSANVPTTNSYKLYLKAYKVGSEFSQCTQHNVAISSRSDLSTSKLNPNPNNGDPLSTVKGTITVNSLLSTIPSVNIVAKNFVSGSNTIPASSVILSPTSLTNVQSGVPKTINVDINIPAAQAAGTYSGDIEISDGAITKIETLQFSVNQKNQVDVLESTIVVSGSEDSTRTREIQLKNTGNTLLSNFNFQFTQSDFSDGGNNIQISFSDPVSLQAGQTKSVTLNLDIPSGVDERDYVGTITVSSGSVSDTFQLTIRVQPELCEEGPKGNLLTISDFDLDDEDIDLEVDNPKIEFTVEVTNNDDDDDIKVTVEAFLWNENEKKKVGKDVKESATIDEDDDYTFDLEIEIDEFDEDEIGEDDDYTLYIKAYEKGDEDVECVEHRESGIDIERPEDPYVKVKSITISPTTLSCGGTIDFRTTVQNIATEDDDTVYVRIVEDSLGLDMRSDRFTLDEYDDRDNSETVSLSYTVPEDADDGEYQAEVRSVFDNGRGRHDKLVSFTINNCDGSVGVVGDGKTTTGSDTGTPPVTNTPPTTDNDGRSRTVEFRPVSAFDSFDGKLIFWIIGDIVLVLIAILFIKLIFTTGRPKV